MDYTIIRKELHSPPLPSTINKGAQILLGLLTIGPWAIFLLYDVLLYIFRAIAYDIPYIGGRARGRQRPRAPNLAQRPSGRPRTLSLTSGRTRGADDFEHETFKQRRSKLGMGTEGTDATEDDQRQ